MTAVAKDVAAALCLPPSTQRSAQVQGLWRDIAAQHGPYMQGLQRLREQTTKPNDDTPMQAVERRHLLTHGPTRSGNWAKITEMVSRQLLPSSFPPLITESSEIVRGPEYGPLNFMMQALFDMANPRAGDIGLVPDTHYRDIPLSGAYFLNLLQAARRVLLARGHDGPVRFIDVGCGGGTKVLAASAMFEVAHGLEYSPAYVKNGRKFLAKLGADPTTLLEGDALTFDDYGSYDVIYFYRPLKNLDAAFRMEARVLEQARPGTVILAPLNVSLGRRDDGVGRVLDKVYLTGTSRAEAQDLADLAQQKGCETRTTGPEDPVAFGFWEPILRQSRRNGFTLT